jgi:hypothetical protein
MGDAFLSAPAMDYAAAMAAPFDFAFLWRWRCINAAVIFAGGLCFQWIVHTVAETVRT